MLHMVAKRERRAAGDVIGAAVRQLDHLVGGVLHDIGIVAAFAGQHVDAGVAGDGIAQVVAGGVDVAVADEEHVLHIGLAA